MSIRIENEPSTTSSRPPNEYDDFEYWSKLGCGSSPPPPVCSNESTTGKTNLDGYYSRKYNSSYESNCDISVGGLVFFFSLTLNHNFDSSFDYSSSIYTNICAFSFNFILLFCLFIISRFLNFVMLLGL